MARKSRIHPGANPTCHIDLIAKYGCSPGDEPCRTSLKILPIKGQYGRTIRIEANDWQMSTSPWIAIDIPEVTTRGKKRSTKMIWSSLDDICPQILGKGHYRIF